VRLLATVPATVANLGPGFDALALALDLRNDVEADPDGPPGVRVLGEGAGELPDDGSNLVVTAMRLVSDEVGRALPPLAVRCRNRIPLERGLGSSAAAAVAGLVLADRLLGTGLAAGRTDLLVLAARLEGHADNAAAALLGGLTIATSDEGGSWSAVRLEPHPGLRPVVLVPEHRTSTTAARRALPRQVPFTDAAFTAGRAALLVHALTARPDLLGTALEERIHQGARLALAPATLALFERLRGDGVPVCVAGSGPSLLAFEPDGGLPTPPGEGWRALRLPVAAAGAEVETEG
jgi:homoserine kinase